MAAYTQDPGLAIVDRMRAVTIAPVPQTGWSDERGPHPMSSNRSEAQGGCHVCEAPTSRHQHATRRL